MVSKPDWIPSFFQGSALWLWQKKRKMHSHHIYVTLFHLCYRRLREKKQINARHTICTNKSENKICSTELKWQLLTTHKIYSCVKANFLVWKCQNAQFYYLNNWVNSDLGLPLPKPDLTVPRSSLWIITLSIKQRPALQSTFRSWTRLLPAQVLSFSQSLSLSLSHRHTMSVCKGEKN